MFLLFKDVVHASRDGVFLEGELVFTRIHTVVADWNQERVLYRLKSSNSFMDCAQCLVPSRI